MARIDDFQGGQRRRITDTYETFVRSLALLRGDSLSADQVSRVVGEAVAGASPEELRSPAPPASAIGRIQQLLAQTVEAGRPRNLYGAEAARAAQAAGGVDGPRSGAGFGSIDAIRGSSARYRDLPAGDSMKGTGSSGPSASGGAVTPEFARSFAGTGMVGGTLRTFAEVGLDRGTFDEFRKEGFTKDQIVDSANDSKGLGWKGKEDLSIAQHASLEARKAGVATEQAKTPEERAKRLERERKLERQNEQRSESDPRKQHDRHFWQKRHEDWQRHDQKAGLGAAAKASDKSDEAPRASQDRLMAKEAKKLVASLTAKDADDFGTPAPSASNPSKPAPVRAAAAKPAAGPTLT